MFLFVNVIGINVWKILDYESFILIESFLLASICDWALYELIGSNRDFIDFFVISLCMKLVLIKC